MHEHIDHRIYLVLLGKPSSEIMSGEDSSIVSASRVNRTLAPKGITNEAQHVSQATAHSENNMILHSIYLLPSEFK